MSGRSVRVERLTKTYPPPVAGAEPVHALRDVSLAISDGERVGIIGVNGAGKSTLLQIIAGVMEPTSGSVEVEGDVHAVLTVGMGLRDEATGRENLFLDGAVQGRTREEVAARLDEMIEFAELGEFIDRPMRTYSSGMKARLGFASLISIDPEILIIDEALAVGDAFFSDKAIRAMKRLTDDGAIVLLVTHATAVITQTCQRCIWIDGGRVKMDGDAVEVTEAYQRSIEQRAEVNIARKFGDSGKTWSKGDDLRVERVELKDRHGDEVQETVEAGQPCRLSVDLAGAAVPRVTSLRIWAERNDGLVLCDETLPLNEHTRLSGSAAGLDIDLGRLEWRPSLYQIHVEANTEGGAQAHAAAVFRVWSTKEIFGGSPLLRSPIGIRLVTQVPSDRQVLGSTP